MSAPKNPDKRKLWKERLSRAKTGENNPNFGKMGEKNSWFGKHHTQATKDKLRKALKGKKRPFTQEHRDNLTKALQNRDPEKKKLWKKRLSEVHRGKWIGKKILCLENIIHKNQKIK